MHTVVMKQYITYLTKRVNLHVQLRCQPFL